MIIDYFLNKSDLEKEIIDKSLCLFECPLFPKLGNIFHRVPKDLITKDFLSHIISIDRVEKDIRFRLRGFYITFKSFKSINNTSMSDIFHRFTENCHDRKNKYLSNKTFDAEFITDKFTMHNPYLLTRVYYSLYSLRWLDNDVRKEIMEDIREKEAFMDLYSKVDINSLSNDDLIEYHGSLEDLVIDKLLENLNNRI